MESLRVNFNKIVKKNFRDGRSETKKQQNRLYISNVTDSTDVREPQREDFSQQTDDKIVNRHKIRYTPLELNTLQLEFNQEIFYRIYFTQASVKMIVIMKILF